MSSSGESDDELTMLEDIDDGSQSHMSINRRQERYKIHYRIKRGQAEFKVTLLSTQNMDKGLYKLFMAVVNNISQALLSLV